MKVSRTILFNSDPAVGAVPIGTDGSQFEVDFKPDLHIPKNAKNVTISAPERTVWWTVANIVEDVNNKLYVDDGGAFVIELLTGLYDAPGLNRAISTELVNLGKDNPILNEIGATVSSTFPLLLALPFL